jgi:glycosyltransferase involved in cell wall biosynthesis
MVQRIFVVMPAYNAGATIERVFERIPAAARARIERYVVLNDGSRDTTNEALQRLRASFPTLVTLEHKVNQGYGATERDLLDYARTEGAEVSIVLHSDGQYSPEKIPDLLKPFDEDRADLVQGSRLLDGGALKGGMPFYKFVANKALTALENWSFGMRLAEYHSGYMLYSRRALETIPYGKLSHSFDFDLEMIVMARVKSLRIVELPIPTIYADEASNLKPVEYGFRVLSVVKRYRQGYYHQL